MTGDTPANTTTPPQPAAKRPDTSDLPKSAQEHLEGVGVDVHTADDNLNERLAEIELIGEEAAAGFRGPGIDAIAPSVRYLHVSRTIHQLVNDRNRAVGIYLFVASLLVGASSALTNALDKVDKVPALTPLLTQLIVWCWPTTFAVLGVLGLFAGFLLIRTRIGLIYEVVKMNILLGLPPARVSRISPLSFFFIMHALVSLGSGFASGLSVHMIMTLQGIPGPRTTGVIVGVVSCASLVLCYCFTVLATTREKSLQATKA